MIKQLWHWYYQNSTLSIRNHDNPKCCCACTVANGNSISCLIPCCLCCLALNKNCSPPTHHNMEPDDSQYSPHPHIITNINIEQSLFTHPYLPNPATQWTAMADSGFSWKDSSTTVSHWDVMVSEGAPPSSNWSSCRHNERCHIAESISENMNSEDW